MAKKKDEAAPGGAAAPAEKITQRVAVERALAAGKDSPNDGVAFVQEQFGITLNNGSFSTIKSQIKKAGGATAGNKKRDRPAASANGSATPARAGGISSSGKAPNPADLAQAVKTLVKQYGVAAVADMAKVFAD